MPCKHETKQKMTCTHILFQDNYCPDYSNLKYQVNITTEISILVDHRNCIEEMCVANAQLMGNENESIEVTVMAINDFGASSTISYPTIIGKLLECTHMHV